MYKPYYLLLLCWVGFLIPLGGQISQAVLTQSNCLVKEVKLQLVYFLLILAYSVWQLRGLEALPGQLLDREGPFDLN